MIGFVTGMPAEARLLRGRLVACGRDPESAARHLLAQGATMLASFGIAGGLDPALSPGTLVLATEIIAEKHYDCTALAVTALRAPLAGSDRPLSTMAAKAALWRMSGAAAADMESHRVARVAEAAGVGFMALRAIADPAWRPLPPLALKALDAEGHPRPVRLAAGALAQPRQLPALWRLAQDYRTALKALARCTALLP